MRTTISATLPSGSSSSDQPRVPMTTRSSSRSVLNRRSAPAGSPSRMITSALAASCSWSHACNLSRTSGTLFRAAGGNFVDTANNYTNIFNLVRTANSTASTYVPDLLNLVDIDQWMRVFVFHRILGNWDSWGMGVGQNMYIYKTAGDSWKMFPWDIDFVLGDGNGASDGLWGGPVNAINRMFDTPAFRRMLWRAYREAANGFLTAEQSSAQIDARRDSLLNNRVTEIAEPTGVKTYIAARRQTILSNLAGNDAQSFAITTRNGANFSTATQTVILEGTAKFEVADLLVNGTPLPVEWFDFTSWRLRIPLTATSNALTIQGRDRFGNLIAGASDTGPQPSDLHRSFIDASADHEQNQAALEAERLAAVGVEQTAKEEALKRLSRRTALGLAASGILAVAKGQSEAAAALGLRAGPTRKLVIMPQAMRVIIPPLTSQYLNLTKNSSLAVAIGYPDVVSISNTAINQTGRAVECIAIIMAVYLFTSLTTSGFMNWYNARAAIKER